MDCRPSRRGARRRSRWTAIPRPASSANMAPVPVRAVAAERALEGRRLERPAVEAAAAVAAEGCSPPTDALKAAIAGVLMMAACAVWAQGAVHPGKVPHWWDNALSCSRQETTGGSAAEQAPGRLYA